MNHENCRNEPQCSYCAQDTPICLTDEKERNVSDELAARSALLDFWADRVAGFASHTRHKFYLMLFVNSREIWKKLSNISRSIQNNQITILHVLMTTEEHLQYP